MKSNHTGYLYFGATVNTTEYRDLCVSELRTAREQFAKCQRGSWPIKSYHIVPRRTRTPTISISKHFQEFQVGHTMAWLDTSPETRFCWTMGQVHPHGLRSSVAASIRQGVVVHYGMTSPQQMQGQATDKADLDMACHCLKNFYGLFIT